MPGHLYTSLPHPPRLGEGQSPAGRLCGDGCLAGPTAPHAMGPEVTTLPNPFRFTADTHAHTHTRVHAQYACDPAAVTSAPGQGGESAHDTSLPLTAPAGLPAGRGAEASGAAWAGLVPAVREDGHRDLLYSTAGRWRRAWLNTPPSLRFSLCATGMKTPASQRCTEM